MSGSLGGGAGIAVGLYLAVVLALGVAARRQRTGDSLAEFYLAGRQLSGPVLLSGPVTGFLSAGFFWLIRRPDRIPAP